MSVWIRLNRQRKSHVLLAVDVGKIFFLLRKLLKTQDLSLGAPVSAPILAQPNKLRSLDFRPLALNSTHRPPPTVPPGAGGALSSTRPASRVTCERP